jgi:hypothetical protein
LAGALSELSSRHNEAQLELQRREHAVAQAEAKLAEVRAAQEGERSASAAQLAALHAAHADQLALKEQQLQRDAGAHAAAAAAHRVELEQAQKVHHATAAAHTEALEQLESQAAGAERAEVRAAAAEAKHELLEARLNRIPPQPTLPPSPFRAGDGGARPQRAAAADDAWQQKTTAGASMALTTEALGWLTEALGGLVGWLVGWLVGGRRCRELPGHADWLRAADAGASGHQILCRAPPRLCGGPCTSRVC